MLQSIPKCNLSVVVPMNEVRHRLRLSMHYHQQQLLRNLPFVHALALTMTWYAPSFLRGCVLMKAPKRKGTLNRHNSALVTDVLWLHLRLKLFCLPVWKVTQEPCKGVQAALKLHSVIGHRNDANV